MSVINEKKSVKNIKEICDIIFSLEKKYDLNHMKIQGVYAWQLVRVYVYYEISRKIGVFGSPQQGKVNLKDKAFSFIPFIKNSLFSNPLNGKDHKDVMIFDHPRKVKHNGEYKDIYTYFLLEYLNDAGNSYELIESPYLNKHYSKKENFTKYNDRILFGSYFYKKKNNLKFKTCEKNKISNLQREIISMFNIEIDLFDIFRKHILDFKYQYSMYDKLFKKRTPKYVLVVVAYENKAMVAAAHNNEIEVIELQHGTISEYHLGYNYPNDEDKGLEYFPDKLFTFGEYWNNVANYPISEKNIVSIGFPHLDYTIKDYFNNKKLNQIIFISQGVIGEYLSNFAYELARKLEKINEKINDTDKKNQNNYNIIYKLHPGEYSNWKNNYDSLVKAQKLDNFQIIDNNEISLYELFSKSKYQIGVFSTAIYEGLLFNCKTFIIDLPGSEYMDGLVDKNYVKKVDNVEDIINFMNNLNMDEYDRDLFFKEYDKSILDRTFKK